MKHTGYIFCWLTLGFSSLSCAQQEFRLETLPPQPPVDVAPLVDLWTFECPGGGSATISADTVVNPDGATSPLDLALSVFFDSPTTPVITGDEETNCTDTPVCDFKCPSVTFNCTTGGQYTILIETWRLPDREPNPPNHPIPGTECGTEEGVYDLEVEVFDSADGIGNSIPTGLGARPVERLFAWGIDLPGPAADDVETTLQSQQFEPEVSIALDLYDPLNTSRPDRLPRSKTRGF